MKKIKLLFKTALLASTFVVPTTILTSCKNNTTEETGVEVTNDEWNSAVNYLNLTKSNYKNPWSFANSNADKDYIFMYDTNSSGETQSAIYVTDLVVATNGYRWNQNNAKEPELNSGEVYEIKQNNFYHTTLLDETSVINSSIESYSYAATFLDPAYNFLYDCWSDFQFNATTKCYEFEGETTVKTYHSFKSSIKFSGDKKIKQFDTNVEYENDDGSESFIIASLTFNYDSKTLILPDLVKQEISNHTVEFKSSEDTVTIPIWYVDSNDQIQITIKNNETSFDSLTGYYDEYVDWSSAVIYKNGVLLPSSEYTIDCGIAFSTLVIKDDVIDMTFNLNQGVKEAYMAFYIKRMS